MFKKPIRKTLVEQVAFQIENLIESGHWHIGERIPSEAKLMEQFDVSRNTLREAIQALVHIGLLETRQGRGTVVLSKSSFEAVIQRHLEKADLIETLEVRLALEKEAAHLAAKRRTNHDLIDLKYYIELCELYVETNEQKFLEADINFHKAIVQASHNKLLNELYESMTHILYKSIETLLVMRHELNKEGQVHRDLYEAIKEKNVVKAVESVSVYIDELKEMLHDMKEGEM